MNDAAAPSGLRHRLRMATGDAHARLDAQLGTLDLRRLADYRRFLELSAAALLPLEAVLVHSGVGTIFRDWPQRSRRWAILHDLARVAGVARPLAEPQPLDFGGVLGTMYVLEGSRLGARVLLASVKQSSEPAVTETTAYLGHGAGQPLWPSFIAALERHAATLTDDTTAVVAARRAFDLFAEAASR